MNNKHPTYPNPTIQEAECIDENQATQRMKNEAAIQLIAEWLADESGYDERTWPIVKKAIEENRLSYRRRFGEPSK